MAALHERSGSRKGGRSAIDGPMEVRPKSAIMNRELDGEGVKSEAERVRELSD